MAKTFISLDEAVELSGLSREELEKRIAEKSLRSFLRKGEQVFRREDILRLKEEAPEEEGIMKLLEESEELSLVPEEEEEALVKEEGDLGATTIEKIEGEEAAPIEVSGLEEEKKEEKEEPEVVFEPDEDLKIEPAPEQRTLPPELLEEEEKEAAAEEAPAEEPALAAEVLEEVEEAGEELGEKEMRELGEREEIPAYARALLRPAVQPGVYFLLILSFIFLLISAIILVNSVLGVPQSILKPFMNLFTG